MGSQAFGAGMSFVGSIFGASAQKAQLRSQARIAEINAQVSDNNARQITRAGIIEESRVKMAGSQAKSTQRNQMAASGVDIAGSPTALARLTGTDLVTEVDANTVRANALRAAWGQRFESLNLRNQAKAANATASSISPMMAGLTSLVNSAGQVASSWYTLNELGAFDKGGGVSGTATVGSGADGGLSFLPNGNPWASVSWGASGG